MKFEKQKISQLRTVIERMENGVYENQKELMKAILKVLCSTDKTQFKYNYSSTDFSDNKNLLRLSGLARVKYSGAVVDKEHYIRAGLESMLEA